MLDRFAFQVDLVKPAPDFPMLCYYCVPTSRRAIEQARRTMRSDMDRAAQTEITSGPFLLKEFRPHERTVVSRNPYYFDSMFVGVEKIEFSAADGVTVVNLFRTGLADSMEGRVMPLQLAPRMKGQPTLQVRPACASHGWRISTNRPPAYTTSHFDASN